MKPSEQAGLARIIIALAASPLDTGTEQHFHGHLPRHRVIISTITPVDQLLARSTLDNQLFAELSRAKVLRMPSLSEREADLEPLVEHFLERANREHNARIKSLDPSAMLFLRHQVQKRALEARHVAAMVSRAVAAAEGDTVDMHDFGIFAPKTQSVAVLGENGSEEFLFGEMEAEAMLAANPPAIRLYFDDPSREMPSRVIVHGKEAKFTDDRLLSVLLLLIEAEGQPVEMTAHWPEVGYHRDTPPKRVMHRIREALGDRQIDARTSEFFTNHYRGRYSFNIKRRAALIRRVPQTGADTAESSEP